MRGAVGLLVAVALAAMAAVAGPAAALPADAWSGQWLIPASLTAGSGDQVVTLVQRGASVSGSFFWCGGGAYTGTVSPDGTTWNGEGTHPPNQPGCSVTGTYTFRATMAADARSFTGPGLTGAGNGFTFSATYVGGGTEPRAPAPPAPLPAPIPDPAPARPSCPGGPFAGRWLSPAGNTFSFTQNGSAVFARGLTFPQTINATASGGTARGTYTIPEGSGTALLTLSPDLRTFSFTGTTVQGRPDGPFAWTFAGCDPELVADPRGADLQRVIPNPQVVQAGPTTIVAPGTISITSLVRSKCVLVRVASRRPARALVSIFSGRLSRRLFGQRLVVFRVPAARQVCIRVPFRARTFNVRTPLAVALGYAAGATARPGQRPTRPSIEPIRLVP